MLFESRSGETRLEVIGRRMMVGSGSHREAFMRG